MTNHAIKLLIVAIAICLSTGCLITRKVSGNKLIDSTTELQVSEQPTKNPTLLTPLPLEYLEDAAYPPDDLTFHLPFEGSFKISNGFGFESQWWTHQTIGNTESANDFFALDISMPEGTVILAPADGRVLTAQDRTHLDSYGMYMVIDHGQGYHTVYAHLSHLEFLVDHGSPEILVKQGQKIGESGKTGTKWPHLHFAIHKDSRISHSGADVGGKAVVPEPLSGYYGIRRDHILTGGKPSP